MPNSSVKNHNRYEYVGKDGDSKQKGGSHIERRTGAFERERLGPAPGKPGQVGWTHEPFPKLDICDCGGVR